MTLLFGLDSGGSKTIAVVADAEGHVLDTWRGPGLDPMAGHDWTEHLGRAVSALGGGRHIAAAALGMSCYGEMPAVSAIQRSEAAARFACPHIVLNDVEVACDGAFMGGDGVLVIAGTGSMAWAKQAGESMRFGGWGEVFGDEGSAFWIGREALSLATRALEGRLDDPSGDAASFADGMLLACGVTADGLIDWAFNRTDRRAAHAALARSVSDLALSGNSLATGLLETAAQLLAEHVFAARSAFEDPDLAWSYGGGVFRSPLILSAVSRLAGAPARPRLPPVGGALWRAALHAGINLSHEFTETLAASLDQTMTATGDK